MGIELLSIGAVLAVLGFLWGATKWLIKHFDPHLIRMLDSIDGFKEVGREVKEIGREMVTTQSDVVSAINRAIDVFETQQEWLERFDEVATERHKRIMERLDAQDNTMTQILFAMQECPARKNPKDERGHNV
jgi:DNA-binding transcriptional MerR regulator